jgi:transcriptional regulator with XRE-family HTH domain
MLDFTAPNEKRKVHPTDRTIGENLRRIRLARGLSQEKLADILQMTFQQVQKYEKGENRISGRRLVEIARALKIDLSALFTGTGAFEHDIEPEGVPLTAGLSKGALELATTHDAIVDTAQKVALRNLARTMAKAED